MAMIELSDISFSYTGEPLLSNVNLHIGPRDFIGLVGANGCGKTTLVKLILGLLKPSSGSVRYMLDGKAVPSLAIGYLPQVSRIDPLFPLTVRAAVELGLVTGKSLFMKAGDSVAVDEAMQRVGILHLADKPIGQLSGGELQRTLLARAIVSRPQMLLLDEPDTYLDKKSVDTLYSLLSTLNRDCAVLVVSHNEPRIKEYASHIAYIDGTVDCCRIER